MDPTRPPGRSAERAFSNYFDSFMNSSDRLRQPSLVQQPTQPNPFPSPASGMLSIASSSSSSSRYAYRPSPGSSSAVSFSDGGSLRNHIGGSSSTCSTRITSASPVPSSLGMGISLYSSGTETPMSSRTFLTDGGYYAACSDPGYLSSKHQDCQDGLSYLHGSDDFLYSDDLEFLQHVHEQQQSRRRRGKFVAQRKPRAGEAMAIPEQKVPSNSKGKGRELNPEESRRGRRQTKTSKMSSQTAVLVERDLKTVSRADEPPRAYMEVHTLFVRPPASIFEQQEREKRRAARLERRSDLNRIKEEEGVEEQLGNVSKVKLESGAALKQRKRKSPRYLKYGPETSAWTFQYQDGLASTEGVDMKAVKAEADETKPPAKRKRGRKRIPDALEVALETGAPLHPWAAPVQRSSASLSKAETDDGSLDGESSSSRAATRQGFDLFGRACEFPMATVQPSYTKILRERYRGFAAPGRARLDLEGLWAHRVRVWQAEQLGTWIPGGGGGGGPPYLSNVSAAPPIFLRRNAIAGEQLAVKWDYEDEEHEAPVAGESSNHVTYSAQMYN